MRNIEKVHEEGTSIRNIKMEHKRNIKKKEHKQDHEQERKT